MRLETADVTYPQSEDTADTKRMTNNHGTNHLRLTGFSEAGDKEVGVLQWDPGG